jgi:catechol 2,3-dioxygenase-like lactoylglutathione lyase family enzyme
VRTQQVDLPDGLGAERHRSDGLDPAEQEDLIGTRQVPGRHGSGRLTHGLGSGMALILSIPAMPVQDIPAAVAFYRDRLGFTPGHTGPDFAIVTRDVVDLHLWAASDQSWPKRIGRGHPVRTGAESFIAGTASCRIQVDEVDHLYTEMAAAQVLHPTDTGSPVDTEWGTREFATLDIEGNLLTFFLRTNA